MSTLSVLVVSGALLSSGCGGPSEGATKNRTFYDWAVATGDGGAKEFEEHYPPLDLPATAPRPEYVGVTVLRRGIHLSKPKNWLLRDASNQPGQAYIGYVSPNAYSFAVYERPESTEESWLAMMKRFEDDTQSVGAKIVGQRVPMATGIGQGRAYSVQRSVEAAKKPLTSRSREYLVRGKTRVVVVQIVYEGDELSQVDPELLRVIDTLEVL
ncbi:MAG: hypothetical protein K0R38_7405 [Polyangiaceae bacterium]|nr:hypothetical protein [Polyangiaceae bacterium]